MIYFCIVKKILFLLTFFILFKPLLPLIEYLVNYEYISKVLCVNKEKPAMKCNGKSYLMKQLAKSAETEKPISDKKVVINDFEVLFFQDFKEIIFSKNIYITKQVNNSDYSNLYSYLNSFSVFHPPTVIS